MKPYYEIDNITKTRIYSLIKQCDKLGLENVSFEYHDTTASKGALFYLSKTTMWGLVVSTEHSKYRDAYRIEDNLLNIAYQFSEKD